MDYQRLHATLEKFLLLYERDVICKEKMLHNQSRSILAHNETQMEMASLIKKFKDAIPMLISSFFTKQ